MDSYNPSKRSRDDYEADNAGFNRQGSAGGFEENKRQTVDPTTELIANVCKDIRRIGENSNIVTQVEDISYISNPIVAEFEKIDKLRIAILNTLYSVVVEQPQKITSLSVLILLCNPKNFLVAKYVIEFFHSKAQGLVELLVEKEDEISEGGDKAAVKQIQKQQEEQEFAGIFNNLKSILKFLACLSPIIENFAIIDIFKQFLTLSIDLQKSGIEKGWKRNGLAEEIYYNTLISLPYLLSNNWTEEMREKCNELITLAGEFHNEGIKEELSFTLFEPFYEKGSNFANDIPYQPKNIIGLIYPALLEIQKNNWEDFKGKLFINFEELIEPLIAKSLENNQLSQELIKHQLPQLSLPSVENISIKNKGLIDSLWAKYPRILFQVYNMTTEFETVPSIESYIGLFFKDLSFDILTNLSFNKNETSIQLSILDLYFLANLFAPPGSSIDQLDHVHRDNVSGENTPALSTWKIEDIAIESILTMIFQLPLPLHVEVYYYGVLISCCRELPESIAPVFGRAIRFFYNNLEILDYELKIRFLDWMTIQISNFEFSWKWDEWVEDSKNFRNLKYHPKKNFIKNLIAKEIRLSNKNKIKDTFVTVDPESGNLVKLNEFYKYLSLSLVENEEDFILKYDLDLYGGVEGNSKVKEIFESLSAQRKEKKELQSQLGALIVSPQEELIYNFSLSTVPLNEIANTVYDFVVANWKSNSDFQDLCNLVLLAVDKWNAELHKKEVVEDETTEGEKTTEKSAEEDEEAVKDDAPQPEAEAEAEIDTTEEVKKVEESKESKEDEEMDLDNIDTTGFINKEKYLINLIIQTYVYIGSRSIYSAVSVFSRDIVKLRYLAGWELNEDEASKGNNNSGFSFEPLNLSKEQFNQRQEWIIESIFRVWNHQPQVAFLILEYLIEFEILKSNKLVEYVLSIDRNLLIENVSCMESINRILNNEESENQDEIFGKMFELIVNNLNVILEETLKIPDTEEVLIDKKKFEESEIEDLDFMSKIDNQWLYYEYLGLLKSYIRKYSVKYDKSKEIFETIKNENVKRKVLSWLSEIKSLENV